MNFDVTIERLPEKHFLAIKGYMSFSEIAPSKHSEWERIYGFANKDLIKELKIKSGASEVYQIFCNSCQTDEQFGWVCSDDIACENINNAQASDGFKTIHLASSEYLKIDYLYEGKATSHEQAWKEIDDFYWKEWLKSNPYQSKIEGEFANNPETADITLYDDDNKHITVWYPIKRTE